MKLSSLLLACLILAASAVKSQTNVNVYINGTMSGQYTIKEGQTDGGIWYKKAVYKTAEKFSITVKAKILKSDQYKRKVEAVDDNSNSLYTAQETEANPGNFDLTNKDVLKRLGRGKIVKLYLQLDPANPMSKAPSKRIFIGNLTAK
jgi:hypothetical protein